MSCNQNLSWPPIPSLLTCAHSLVAGHGPIGLDAVLEAVELPAGVTDLATSLADVDGDTLTLQ